ncbi:MAG: ATP-binding cassette domain-containing protein [Actinomycetota bacterium]|nr:ATP-binding cassette domain-containing protein [Actinomycetota bacterium]
MELRRHDASEPSPAHPLAIDIAGFSFAYPESPCVLEGLSWQVPRGAFCLLVGATGSGKTTLLRCLKPEIAPVGERAGEVRVFGRTLGGWGVAESAAGIGYVSQDPDNQIVCDSVWHELAFGLENLGIPPAVMRRRVAEVAQFLGIEPWMHRRTEGLSSGQKQLVNLASVMSMRPRLLLLDEPTAQLDPVAEGNFLHMLFRLNREVGVTVIVATHAPERMVAYADSCVELAGRRVHELDGAVFSTGDGRGPDEVLVSLGRGRLERESDPAGPADPVLRLRDTYVRYGRGEPWVLRGCDLDVAPATVHALVGGNGSGKTTLLRVAAGVLKAEHGKARNQLADDQVLLPQDPKALFVRDTVREELLEWGDACGYTSGEASRMAERFGLQMLLEQHPHDLSGGEQQKLAMAKLLLADPSLLLLDEPTKGLDAAARCDLACELRGLTASGVTVIMVTHDLAFAAVVADAISLLFDGQIICTESVNDFFADNFFYRLREDAFTRAIAARGGVVQGPDPCTTHVPPCGLASVDGGKGPDGQPFDGERS